MQSALRATACVVLRREHKRKVLSTITECTTLLLQHGSLHRPTFIRSIMKSILTSALLLSAALGTVVPRAGKKVDYSGFKVLRVASTEGVKAEIEHLAAHVLNPGKSAQLDVVVSPENVDALTALVAESQVLNEDVGAALAEEGGMTAYAGVLQSSSL